MYCFSSTSQLVVVIRATIKDYFSNKISCQLVWLINNPLINQPNLISL